MKGLIYSEPADRWRLVRDQKGTSLVLTKTPSGLEFVKTHHCALHCIICVLILEGLVSARYNCLSRMRPNNTKRNGSGETAPPDESFA